MAAMNPNTHALASDEYRSGSWARDEKPWK